jgi:hypothetical protein
MEEWKNGKIEKPKSGDCGISCPASLLKPLPKNLGRYCTQSRHPLHDLVEGWNQGLGQPEAEDKLRSSHEKLRRQALEEGRESLVLDHLGDNSEPALGVFKIAILYPCLDHVERC